MLRVRRMTVSRASLRRIFQVARERVSMLEELLRVICKDLPVNWACEHLDLGSGI